jgi:hypothetical protein
MQHKLELPYNANNKLEFGFEWDLIEKSEASYDKTIVATRKALEKLQDKTDENSKKEYAELLFKLAKAYLEKYNNDKEVPPSFEGNNNLIVLACALLALKAEVGDDAKFHRLASTACSNLAHLYDAQKFITWPHTLANTFPFLSEDQARKYCQNMLCISADRHSRAASRI